MLGCEVITKKDGFGKKEHSLERNAEHQHLRDTGEHIRGSRETRSFRTEEAFQIETDITKRMRNDHRINHFQSESSLSIVSSKSINMTSLTLNSTGIQSTASLKSMEFNLDSYLLSINPFSVQTGIFEVTNPEKSVPLINFTESTKKTQATTVNRTIIRSMDSSISESGFSHIPLSPSQIEQVSSGNSNVFRVLNSQDDSKSLEIVSTKSFNQNTTSKKQLLTNGAINSSVLSFYEPSRQLINSTIEHSSKMYTNHTELKSQTATERSNLPIGGSFSPQNEPKTLTRDAENISQRDPNYSSTNTILHPRTTFEESTVFTQHASSYQSEHIESSFVTDSFQFNSFGSGLLESSRIPRSQFTETARMQSVSATISILPIDHVPSITKTAPAHMITSFSLEAHQSSYMKRSEKIIDPPEVHITKDDSSFSNLTEDKRSREEKERITDESASNTNVKPSKFSSIFENAGFSATRNTVSFDNSGIPMQFRSIKIPGVDSKKNTDKPSIKLDRKSISKSTQSSLTNSAMNSPQTLTKDIKVTITSKADTTDNSILDLTHNIHDIPDEPENHPNSYISVDLEVSWSTFCIHLEAFKSAIVNAMHMLAGIEVKLERIRLFNLHKCQADTKKKDFDFKIRVYFYIKQSIGDKTDEVLTHTCAEILKNLHILPSKILYKRILAVHKYCKSPCKMIKKSLKLPEETTGNSLIAIYTLSAISFICVVSILILMAFLRWRQRNRCSKNNRRSSIDGHSLDTLSFRSFRHSFRSRKSRRSRRSYVNFAFSDPDAPSQLLNTAALISYAANETLLKEQYETIPMISPKRNELPSGVEPKNRYSNGIPIPETRVSLTLKPGMPNSDYINANFVRGYRNELNSYIGCQAPLDSTIEDFWRMVWEQQVSVIVMLTLMEENGIKKSSHYFPDSDTVDSHRCFNNFQVSLNERDVREKYVISTFQLRHMENNLMREIHHFWYTDWPIIGVPKNANGFLSFMEECQALMKGQPGPTIVHCSAGTGRTGVFICIDICMQQLKDTRFVDILNCVYKVRNDRSGAVKTKDQYIFLYQILAEYSERISHSNSKRPSLKSEL
ncbi:Tyrosine-protein phosphatase non-receptor type 5 [Nymphon striatum]|nr:Tyrosine-protein phosphatase non-receptor type 5 [Nymphon striatum]